MSRVPSGSRPLVGSSRRISSGSLMRACARPIRRVIPFGVFLELAAAGVLQPDHLDQLVAASLRTAWGTC